MSTQAQVRVRVAQMFGTTVLDLEQGIGFDASFIPFHSMAEGIDTSSPASVLESIGGSVVSTLEPDAVAYALTAVLELQTGDVPQAGDISLESLAADHPYTYDFAVTFSERSVIPVEQSALSGEPLAALAASSPVGAGVLLGVIAASASPWVVVVAIPAGIILCFAATGIGERMRKLLAGSEANQSGKNKTKKSKKS